MAIRGGRPPFPAPTRTAEFSEERWHSRRRGLLVNLIADCYTLAGPQKGPKVVLKCVVREARHRYPLARNDPRGEGKAASQRSRHPCEAAQSRRRTEKAAACWDAAAWPPRMP